jgi:3-phenylpropionate/cinnamic acid dioxygenase small subunit
MVSRAQDDVKAVEHLRHDDPDYLDAYFFLVEEAELLDDYDLKSWLELLAPNVRYTLPVQTTRPRGATRTELPPSYLFEEDRNTLGLRVKRLLESDSAWAESPPSRTRRFVSNVRVGRSEDGQLHVRSYELLLRSRSDRKEFDLVSLERDDLLERDGDRRLRLKSREFTIDQSRLAVRGLPVPL